MTSCVGQLTCINNRLLSDEVTDAISDGLNMHAILQQLAAFASHSAALHLVGEGVGVQPGSGCV